MSSPSPYALTLQPLGRLLPSEETDPQHVQALAARIVACGEWRVPLPVERSTGLVMDGNHRLRAAALLDLACVPCILLGYEDPRVTVHCWRTHAPFDVARILTSAEQRTLFPFKTTRHRFEPPLPDCRIPLAALRRSVSLPRKEKEG